MGNDGSDDDKKRSSVELYVLKNQIKRLKKKRSFNQATVLVTIYIPPGTQLSEIANLLRNEYGTASNIKDKNTGKAVQAAISSILSRMKLLRNGPNGLVIFCGQTQDGMEFYAIDNPPEPVSIKQYICDTHFHTEHLEAMLEEKDQFGLIVVDRGGATFAVVRGNNLKIVYSRDSFVPSKHDAGGQSQRRIERGIEILAHEFYNRIAEAANKIFLEEYPVKGIVVGGPSVSKDEFVKNPNLDYRIRQKILDTVDIGYSGEQGVRELLQRSSNILKEVRLVEEKNLINKFLENVAKDTGMVAYGEEEVKRALEMAAADTVLVSEEVDKVRITLVCETCGHEFIETVLNKDYDSFMDSLNVKQCPKCGATRLKVKEEVDLVEELSEMAKATGAKIEIISTEHEDGKMLAKGFGGIAAILRYKIDY